MYMYKTNRLHLAVHVDSDNARMTSKRGKSIIGHPTPLRLVVYVFVLTTFCCHLCIIRVHTHCQMEIYLLNVSVLLLNNMNQALFCNAYDNHSLELLEYVTCKYIL